MPFFWLSRITIPPPPPPPGPMSNPPGPPAESSPPPLPPAADKVVYIRSSFCPNNEMVPPLPPPEGEPPSLPFAMMENPPGIYMLFPPVAMIFPSAKLNSASAGSLTAEGAGNSAPAAAS